VSRLSPLRREGASETARARAPSTPSKRASAAPRPKLGGAHTSAEASADRAAERAVRAPTRVESATPDPLARATSPHVARELEALHGEGAPLPPTTRRFFEARYGTDLARVRVHDSPRAHALTRELGARALTIGEQIAFAPGEYAPESPEGRALLAHELAHVVQERGAEEPVVRRALPTGSAARAAAEGLPKTSGKLEGGTVVFDHVAIPAFKASAHRAGKYTSRASARKLRRVAPFRRGDPNQIREWERSVSRRTVEAADEAPSAITTIRTLLEEKIRQAYALDALPDRGRVVIETPGASGPEHTAGTIASLSTRRLRRPMWGDHGAYVAMEVDHVVELQLGNWGSGRGSDTWANTLENMELLDESANGPSGGAILREIEDRARTHLLAWRAALGEPATAEHADVRALLDDRHFLFESFVGSPAMGGLVASHQFWTFDQLSRGEHLAHVRIADESYTGGRGEVRVLLRADDRSIARTFAWSHTDGRSDVPAAEADFDGRFGPFRFVSKQFATDGPVESTTELGTLWMNVLQADAKWKPLDEPIAVPVRRVPGARYAGVIDTATLLTHVPDLEVKGLSAVTVQTSSFDPAVGLIARGVVQPDYAEGDTALVGEGDAGRPTFVIEGARQEVEGTIPTEALDPPGPITVTSSSIAISSDESGVRVDGSAEIEIRDLAHGSVEASLGASGFLLGGRLEVDTTYFRAARVALAYDTEAGMSGSAELELDTSGLPGVESGTVSVSVANALWTVSGSARFRALGVDAQIGVTWSEAEGLTVAGRIPIPDGRIPGVRGAWIEGRVTRTPEGELRFGASGHGEPAVAGLTGGVDVSWDQGVFRVDGTVGASHDNLSGSVHLGVTNQALDEAGEPTGDPTDTLSLFGGGRLDVTFGRYLRGSAEVEILPNGEMQIRGAIGLADELELFPRREISRRLFGLDLEIPIAGIVVLGRGFGIFAFIGGGLDASAGFGPAVLRDTEVSVTLNPARPADTVVEGHAELFLPADAGLRLFVRAGIGGSLLIADVRGGIEIGGAIGVEAEARARLDVRWTPTEGLRIEALAEALARPVLRLDVTGFAEVNVALLGTVWETRYQIAGFDVGSDLELGVRYPLVIQEGQPIEIRWEDLELIVPDLDLETIFGQVLARD
jgi:hypothetical protein